MKNKVHAKLVNLGVDIIDHDGDMLTGISEQDAVDLHASLTRLLPKIKRRIEKEMGHAAPVVRGEPT